MADELTELLQKFSLAGKELEGPEFTEEDMQNCILECEKSLIGKIFGDKAVNFLGIRNFVKQICRFEENTGEGKNDSQFRVWLKANGGRKSSPRESYSNKGIGKGDKNMGLDVQNDKISTKSGGERSSEAEEKGKEVSRGELGVGKEELQVIITKEWARGNENERRIDGKNERLEEEKQGDSEIVDVEEKGYGDEMAIEEQQGKNRGIWANPNRGNLSEEAPKVKQEAHN
ncbi:hypothetical protein ACH5RR_000945 [Cinchona calisaya]|uniref:Uncharacterized protein n=1 Tax=Cinchona calisaya TaxID=153742 RepID=A0ABD3B283_9GENT